MSDAVAKANLRSLAGMLRYARPYRAQWAGIVVLTLLTSAFALLTPWPMQVLVDHVLGSVPPPPMLVRLTRLVPGTSETRAMIGFVVFAGLVLLLVGAALDALLTIAWVRVGQRMVYDLACDLFARIQRRSLLFHTRNSVGDLMSRVTGDSWCVYSMVEMLLLAPGRALIMTVLMVVLMARMDWKLTLAALALAPFMAGASYWLAPPIRLASKLRREVESRLLSHVQQTLSGVPVVQAFAAEEREQQRFREFADAAIGAQKRTTVAGQFHQLGTGLIATLGSAVILWVGVRQVLAGTLTLGAVLLFVAYLAMLQDQMRAFVGLWATVQALSANVDRVNEILDVPTEVAESPGAVEIARARGDVRFENVTFGYESDRPVLSGVTLDLPAGSTLAVVGPSGVGKSTLAALVPRFFDPWDGRVTLDGRDVRGYTIASLRRQVAVVLQEPFLFPMTVADNIAYGTEGATRQQIESAARAAGADEFVRRLPQGYDTVIGERGATLSGGERQRLSIARALLKNAPVLILDEPTASLDAATESKLLHALQTLMRGRTTLVIAHRLSTIRNADRIVVLEHGRIAEQGTHDELIELGGRYAALCARQSGRPQRELVTEA
jgi:ATP-binding cassette subfamily B protein/subfamily B ATP-binding cassette protein MsbA